MALDIPSDVHNRKLYYDLNKIYCGLHQEDKERVACFGRYGFWEIDNTEPREERLALVLRTLGLIDDDFLAKRQKFKMNGGAEEYEEIMAAQKLMNVR